jgi:hypothetical protein
MPKRHVALIIQMHKLFPVCWAELSHVAGLFLSLRLVLSQFDSPM